jgi:hypothetical protein
MTDASLTSLIAGAAATYLGLVFAHGAWHKITDFDSFTGFVADYQVVPTTIISVVSKFIVGAEMAMPLALLIHQGRKYSAALAIALLLGYASAMTVNLLRGRTQIDCGCGNATQPLAWSLVVRNCALAGIATLILLPTGGPDLSVAEVAAVLGGGFIAWVTLGVVGQVLFNRVRMRMLLAERN